MAIKMEIYSCSLVHQGKKEAPMGENKMSIKVLETIFLAAEVTEFNLVQHELCCCKMQTKEGGLVCLY